MALAIPFFILALVLVASGTPFIQHSHSHGFLKWFVNAVKFVGYKENWVLQQAVKLTKWVVHELGPIYEATYGRATTWISTLNHYVYVVGYWSLYWPIALKHEVDHLRHKTIPSIVDSRTAPIKQTAEQAEADARAAAGQAHSRVSSPAKPGTVKDVTVIKKVAMPHAQEWEWVHDHWKAAKAAILGATAAAIAVPVPGGIPWRNPLDALRRAHGKRLKRVEALLGVAAFAVVLSRVLGVSVKCLKPSGNVGKTARRLCGLNAGLLDALLLGTTLLAGPMSIVTFAEGMLDIEEEIVGLIKAGITEIADV